MSEELPPEPVEKPTGAVPEDAHDRNFARAVQGCLLVVGILTLTVAAATVICLLSGLVSVSSLLSSINNFLRVPGITADVASSRTILTSLQPLGQLVSISAEVAQADIRVSVNTGGINLCGHSANHVAQGVIEAGTDLTQLSEESIRYDAASDTYTLTLPAPAITSCRIEYIRQYERSGGGLACPVDWDNIRLLAQYQATKQFAADTLEAGILARAEREAQILMQTFVGALVGKQVRVMWAPASADALLPASCQPQLPHGWAFNSELNAWVKIG